VRGDHAATMPMRRRAFLAAAGLLWVGASASAEAPEDWPARPVKFIVPSSPGGGTDIYARLLARALSDALKQQFIVENRPGASGNIGATAAAKAPADGYTFLVSANPALTVNESLYKDLPYSAERDFAAVARGVFTPLVLVAHPSAARTLAELIERGRREPRKLSYGSAGTGSPTYLGVRMLEERTGARFLHVAYKGLGPAYQDLLGGQIQFLFPDTGSALPHIRAGKILALAVNRESTQLPAVPTFTQAGIPDFDIVGSFSVVAPRATPSGIVSRLSREITTAMKSPELGARLESQGFVPEFDTPEDFAESLKKERADFAELIRRNGIAPTD
jgi:tripartite-type tricarboxylate transporter receptor subunit TctC